MKIPGFKKFEGQHCETTATGCLLQHLGIDLTEPMLFGLGEGLGFIFWKMKTMDFPFIGGRIKTDLVTQNICRNLNLALSVRETTSIQQAWQNVSVPVSEGRPVGLKLDCFHLEYFSTPFHFAGHYVAMYGYDDRYAYLVDTRQQGGAVKTSLESLSLARSEKGPMSSRNLSYTISGTREFPNLAKVTVAAILNNAREYLAPPIKNLSFKGILKTSKEIKLWFDSSENRKRDFQTTSMLMERAGTGGALFRNLYRDFLREAYELTSLPEIGLAANQFISIAKQWNAVSELFYEAGETEDVKYINDASDLLVEIAANEKSAMEELISTLHC